MTVYEKITAVYSTKNIEYTRVAQIFQKSRNHLKILGARRVTRNKFHTEVPQILGATTQNLVKAT
jgi:Leu/Phe-tRNA-protein transferase